MEGLSAALAGKTRRAALSEARPVEVMYRRDNCWPFYTALFLKLGSVLRSTSRLFSTEVRLFSWSRDGPARSPQKPGNTSIIFARLSRGTIPLAEFEIKE